MSNKIKNYLIEPKHQKNHSSNYSLNNYKIIHDATIIKIINSLKNNTARGHDNVTPEIIKNNSLSLVIPLLHILNSSISQPIFPNIFKLALIS